MANQGTIDHYVYSKTCDNYIFNAIYMASLQAIYRRIQGLIVCKIRNAGWV